MNLFNKLFGSSNASKPANTRQVSTGIDEFVYLLDYRAHYGQVLGQHMSDKALAELYLFRGWTTQFGFRIFSAKPEVSEQLITQTVTYTMHVGQKLFYEKHNINIEECLGNSYMNLLDSRWQSYDLIFVNNKNGDNFAAPQITWQLMKHLNINDVIVSMMLEGMFSIHLLAVKERAKILKLI